MKKFVSFLLIVFSMIVNVNPSFAKRITLRELSIDFPDTWEVKRNQDEIINLFSSSFGKINIAFGKNTKNIKLNPCDLLKDFLDETKAKMKNDFKIVEEGEGESKIDKFSILTCGSSDTFESSGLSVRLVSTLSLLSSDNWNTFYVIIAQALPSKENGVIYAKILASIQSVEQEPPEPPTPPRHTDSTEKETPPPSRRETSSYPDNGSFGIGMGIPYGIFGINIDLMMSDTLAVSGGIGHTIFAGMGYNFGVKYYLREIGNTWRPRLMAFYGTNSLIDVVGHYSYWKTYNDVSETYDGLTLGIGQQWTFGESKKHGLDLDLMWIVSRGGFDDRVDELDHQGYDMNDIGTGRIKISFGYRYCF